MHLQNFISLALIPLLLSGCTALNASNLAILKSNSRYYPIDGTAVDLKKKEQPPKKVYFHKGKNQINADGIRFTIDEQDYCEYKIDYRQAFRSSDKSDDTIMAKMLKVDSFGGQMALATMLDVSILSGAYLAAYQAANEDINLSPADWQQTQQSYVYAGLGLASLTGVSLGFLARKNKPKKVNTRTISNLCHPKRPISSTTKVNIKSASKTFPVTVKNGVAFAKAADIGTAILHSSLTNTLAVTKNWSVSAKTPSGNKLPGNQFYAKNGATASQALSLNQEQAQPFLQKWICASQQSKEGHQVLHSNSIQNIERFWQRYRTCDLKASVQSYCAFTKKTMQKYFKVDKSSASKTHLSANDVKILKLRCPWKNEISNQAFALFQQAMKAENIVLSLHLTKDFTAVHNQTRQSQMERMTAGLEKAFLKRAQDKFLAEYKAKLTTLKSATSNFSSAALATAEKIDEGETLFSAKWKGKEYKTLTSSALKKIQAQAKNEEFYSARRLRDSLANALGKSFVTKATSTIDKAEKKAEKRAAAAEKKKKRKNYNACIKMYSGNFLCDRAPKIFCGNRCGRGHPVCPCCYYPSKSKKSMCKHHLK